MCSSKSPDDIFTIDSNNFDELTNHKLRIGFLPFSRATSFNAHLEKVSFIVVSKPAGSSADRVLEVQQRF
jgi:hypothetical protein